MGTIIFADDDEACDAAPSAAPAAAPTANAIVARVRRLMLISALTTLIAIGAVIAVIGYRIVRSGDGPAAPASGMIAIPQGARVLSTGLAGDRIAVTLEVSGATETRLYDLKTLKEVGRIRFVPAP